MKNQKQILESALRVTVVLLVIVHLLGGVIAFAQSYKLNFTRSPDETNNAVLQYIAVWEYTNAASSNTWAVFGNNALALIYTNNPTPPRAPGVPTLSN